MSFEEIRAGLSLKNDELCKRVFKQHKNGRFCDVNLCIGKKEWIFEVHRSVLAANSPYFEGNFSR